MAAVWPAGPEPIMTTLECMVRAGGGASALASRATKGRDANGRAREARKGVMPTRRRVEANTLTVVYRCFVEGVGLYIKCAKVA